MPACLNENVVDSVAATNFKTLAEGAAFYANLGMANAVADQQAARQDHQSHRNRMSILAEAALAKSIKNLDSLTPAEAVSDTQEFSNNGLAAQLSSLGSAIAGIQEFLKGANTVPPQTGGQAGSSSAPATK